MGDTDEAPLVGTELVFKRRGKGLTFDEVRDSNSDLLRCKLVNRLVPHDAGERTRAIALYGAIHTLIRAGAQGADGEKYDLLAYAFNLDISREWNHEEMVLLHNSNVGQRRDEANGTAQPRLVGPVDGISSGLDRRNIIKREDEAWVKIVDNLVNPNRKLPALLLQWSEDTLTSSTVLIDVLPTVGMYEERERELVEASEYLATKRSVLITGFGGMGKSQLAARIVELMRQEGLSRVCWLDCSSIRAEDRFVAFGEKLGAFQDTAVSASIDLGSVSTGGEKRGAHLWNADFFDAGSGDEVTDSRFSATKQFLIDSQQPWVLVMDNVQDTDTFMRFAPLASANGMIIATSWVRGLIPGMDEVELDRLELDQATSLLARLSQKPDDPDIENAANELGCHPLALTQAGAYCRHVGALRDYLTELDEVPLIYMTSDPSRNPYYRDEDKDTLYKTWYLLMCAASSEADHVWDVFLTAAYLDGSQILDQLLVLLYKEPDAAEAALRSLHRYSLIRRGKDSFSVHRISQRLGREFIASEVGNARHAASLLDIFGGPGVPDPDEVPHWPTYEMLLPHLISWLETVDLAQIKRSVRLVPERGPMAELTSEQLCGIFEPYLLVILHSRQIGGHELCGKLIAALEEELNSQSAQYGRFLLIRAEIGARNLTNQSAVNDARLGHGLVEEHSSEVLDKVEAMRALAVVLRDRGHDEEAAQWLERAIERLPDDEQERLFYVELLRQLAIVYRNMRRIDEARNLFDRAASVLVEIGYEQGARQISAEGNVDRGDPDDVESFRSVYQQSVELLGTNSPRTLESKAALGCMLCACGEHEEGLFLMKDAAASMLEQSPITELDVLLMQTQLSYAFTHTGNYEQAMLLNQWLVHRFSRSANPSSSHVERAKSDWSYNAGELLKKEHLDYDLLLQNLADFAEQFEDHDEFRLRVVMCSFILYYDRLSDGDTARSLVASAMDRFIITGGDVEHEMFKRSQLALTAIDRGTPLIPQ